MLPAAGCVDRNIAGLPCHDWTHTAKVIEVQMRINNGYHRFVGKAPELFNRLRGCCGEPAAINHDDAVIALNKSMIGIPNKLRGENAAADFS